MEDSYKFAVGDHIGAVDNDGAPLDSGALVSINRTTYSNQAVLTLGGALTATIAIADGGGLFIQTQTTTPFTNAVGVLVGGVETGTGANAKGGQGVIVLSNAMLYKGLIPNYDAGALTDLGGSVRNQFLILK